MQNNDKTLLLSFKSGKRAGVKDKTRIRKDSTKDKKANTNTGPNDIALTLLTKPQMEKVLDKLQLIPPAVYDKDVYLNLLSCSKVFMRHFSGFKTLLTGTGCLGWSGTFQGARAKT